MRKPIKKDTRKGNLIKEYSKDILMLEDTDRINFSEIEETRKKLKRFGY